MFRRSVSYVSVVVLAIGFGVVIRAADWPAFRGASAAGAGAGNPPVSWNVTAGTNVAWRVEVPGLGHSSPIVAGQRVFLTTAVAIDGAAAPVTTGDVSRSGIDSAADTGVHEWRLYAFDRQSGKVLWHEVAHRGAPRTKRHVKASHASATPATDGRVVVALMGSQGLYCYSVEGKLLWQRDLGVMDTGLVDDPTYQWGPASSPVITGNRVLVQNDQHRGSFLAAYDLASGKELWRTTRDEMPSWATPVVARVGARSIVVTNSPRRIAAYDLETGREIWHFVDGTQVKVPTPVLSGGLAIVTGGYAPGARPTFAIRLDSTGAVAVGDLAWQIDRGSPYTSTPLVHEGLLYMLTDAGILSAYDAASGVRIYQQRVSPTAGGFSASPVVGAGRIYLTSEDGDVFVVRAGRTFELLATNPLGEIALATPALDGDLFIVRTRGRIVAIGRP